MTLPDSSQVGACFLRSLDSYNQQAEVQRRMADELCLRIGIGRPFATILELGCGTGVLTDALERYFPHTRLLLTDLVAECARFHRLRPGATFFPLDLNQETELPAAHLVVSNAMLQWIGDPAALMRRIRRALPHGGELAFSTFLPGNLQEIEELTGNTLPYLPLTELQKLTTQAGFRIECAYAEKIVREFSSVKEVLRHLSQTGVNANAAPQRWTPSRHRKFERQYEGLRNRSGRLPLTYLPAYIHAVAE